MNKLFALIIGALLVCGGAAHANKHIIGGAATASFGSLRNSPGIPSTSYFEMSGTYQYVYSRHVLFAASANFSLISDVTTTTTKLDPGLGATYSFGGDDLKNDFFVGFQITTTFFMAPTSLQGLWYLPITAGKRFRLAESVSYSPSISASIPLSSTGTSNIVVRLVALEVFL